MRQMRQVTWMPLLLLIVVLRRSGVGYVRINYCWTRKKPPIRSALVPSSRITESPDAAARLMFQESRFCHITPLLKSLHWLPVKYRIVFKIVLITFKAIHGLASAYISELISVRNTRRYDFRSNDGLLTTLGDRSFHAAAPKLWNDLPGSIRNSQSLNKFKKAIKTVLFAKFYLICI